MSDHSVSYLQPAVLCEVKFLTMTYQRLLYPNLICAMAFLVTLSSEPAFVTLSYFFPQTCSAIPDSACVHVVSFPYLFICQLNH